MLGFIKTLKTLQDRTPLGLLQLKHDRLRLLTAIAGITFADILIFMQLGFADALYKSNTQYPRALQSDLVILSTQAKNFGQLRTFARRRLYQAQDVPGVLSADALYLGSVQWRNPQTRQQTSMLLVGQNLAQPAFELPEINQQLNAVQLPDTVLFDRASRGDYGEMIVQVEQGKPVTTEIGLRTVTVTGLFEVGASFSDDGALITSDQNFLRLFPRREAGAVSLGLIRLEPGYDPKQVRASLAARLPDDVQVLTHQGYIDFELNDIQSESPIGFVFGLGSAMGFIVGVVIVYQVLSTDVNSHLAEYATFRAMGYRNTYLLGVVFEEALILSVLGFIPGLIIALGAYQITAAATALPLAMPASRAATVLLLTFAMCGASGAVATRRLQAADPADIF
ncbi:MAG: FtsX-like permease family protein [Leptolyngbyaceae cyanobacterium SM1_1_3]|nr:FtsX-like permease family protein [Leptolyngbyaceae cyanobacterium SM1_1_3]NJN04462.1 FtsX-like permease family protein [Leptolyngbyaceae cyanobacterium RM1_1_2]NJO10068.1 FtsX-like permease family protein [Leptolyngbyaceae cyanobacterium SL_1_1]